MKRLLFFLLLIFQIFQNCNLQAMYYRDTRADCSRKTSKPSFMPLASLKGEDFGRRLSEVKKLFNDKSSSVVDAQKFEGCRSLNDFVNKKDTGGFTLLAGTAARREMGKVKLLLENGADSNISNDFTQKTPLSIAADKGFWDIVNLLLSYASDPNLKDKNGKTALHWSAKSNHIQIVEKLIRNNKTDVNIQDSGGHTPLHFALLEGNYEIVELLLNNGVDINRQKYNGATALFLAVTKKNQAIIRLLLERGANYSLTINSGKTPLMIAVANNDIESVALLLQFGADPTADTQTRRDPFVSAINDDRKEIVLKMLDYINKDNNAIVNTRTSVGSTPIFWAAKKGYLDIVKKLVEKGANVNHLDNNNRTVLYAAVEGGRVDIINYLLDSGAKKVINDVDARGRNVLGWACYNGKAAIVFSLLRRNAEAQKYDYQKMSPLLLSIQSGDLNTVKAVVKHLTNDQLFDSFKVVSSYKIRNCLSWLLRMHPNAPEKKLKLYSKEDFDELFRLLVTPELLKHINILHKDCYGCNVVYWLSIVGDHKNLKFLFDTLSEISGGIGAIQKLLSNRATDERLTPLEKVESKIKYTISKMNGLVESEGISFDPDNKELDDLDQRLHDLNKVKDLINSSLNTAFSSKKRKFEVGGVGGDSRKKMAKKIKYKII